MTGALAYFGIDSLGDLIWVMIGLAAQTMFSLRFILQWLSSEKQGRSVIPEMFWWFSLGGGCLLLLYGIHRREPVLIFGQATGSVIYIRNLWLIRRQRTVPVDVV